MKYFLFAVLIALVPSVASAQTTAVALNPTTLSFTASPDHNAVKLDGTPVLTRYEASWVAQNVVGAIAFTKVLGKPAVDGSNIVSVAVAEFATLPVETVFKATIAAVGPDGTTLSPASNPFGRPGPARPPAAPGSPTAK